MNSNYGTLTTSDDGPTVNFERIIDASIDKVWAMLTTNNGLQLWLAPASVDLRVGGTIDIDFGEGEMVGGKITDLVPESILEYHWRFTGEPDSIIRFELEAVNANTTRLTLNHRLLPADQATGYAAGWHAHLDQLEEAGIGNQPFDWMERFDAVLPEYQSVIS